MSEEIMGHETPETRIIVGYCDTCKKPIEQREQYEVVRSRASQRIYCQSCYLKKKQAEAANAYSNEKKNFRRSMIWGPVAAVVVAAIGIALAVSTDDMVYLSLLAVAALAFAFVAQCFWASFPLEILAFFCRSFRLPMLIFTLDLDGIIWFITVKLTLSILCGILSALLFCVGLAVALGISLFTFPFCLIHELNEIKRLRDAL